MRSPRPSGGRARHRGGDSKGGSLAVTPAAGSLSRSVAVLRDVAGLVGVALLALVANRGGDCRNPDLAVAIVEALVLALEVLALLRRPFRVHCLTLQSVRGVSHGYYVGIEWGEIARQFVSY